MNNMKSTYIVLFASLLMSLSIVSCSDKDDDPMKVWDYYAIEMMVRVSDANGNDLLAPDVETRS